MEKLFRALTVLLLGLCVYLFMQLPTGIPREEGKLNLETPISMSEFSALKKEVKNLKLEIDVLKIKKIAAAQSASESRVLGESNMPKPDVETLVAQGVKKALAEQKKIDVKRSEKKGYGKDGELKTLEALAQELEIDDITFERIKIARQETTDKIIALMLKEGESVEGYRRNLKEAETNDEVRSQMQQRVKDVWQSGDLSPMKQIIQTHETQLQEMLGEDLARRFHLMSGGLQDQPDIFLKR